MDGVCDRSVCVGTLLAWVAWTTGVGLILLNCFGAVPEALALLGLACVGLGCVLSVRLMLDRMDRREKAAYELGRESVRRIR